MINLAQRIDADVSILDNLPSLSPVVMRLTTTLAREDVEVRELEDIIRQDPVVTARVVGAANAAAFAARTRTTTVREALLRIGVTRVRQLALMAGLCSAPRGRGAPPAFWRHSLAVAQATQVVARHVRTSATGPDGEVLFLAGLLHDIGFLALTTHFPREYVVARTATAEANLPLWEAERRVLGLDHGELGQRLTTHWSLPAELTGIIRAHHQFDAVADHQWGGALIRVADAAVSAEPIWDLGEGGVLSAEDQSLAVLGLEPGDLHRMVEDVLAEAEHSASVFEAVG